MNTTSRWGPSPLSTCLAARLYNALSAYSGLLPGSPGPSHVGPLLVTRLSTNLVARENTAHERRSGMPSCSVEFFGILRVYKLKLTAPDCVALYLYRCISQAHNIAKLCIQKLSSSRRRPSFLLRLHSLLTVKDLTLRPMPTQHAQRSTSETTNETTRQRLGRSAMTRTQSFVKNGECSSQLTPTAKDY